MEVLLDPKKQYTYADYLTWLDDKRRELVNGFVYMMSAPKIKHQEISGNLFGELRQIIKKNKGKCKVYPAPFDVRLPKNGEKDDNQIYTVVQPDICIVCDPAKLEDERGCLGAPDFIAEIQSPSTAKYDLNEKFMLYETVGVREYWVVFPYDKSIIQFILQPDGKYDNGTLYETGKIPVTIFDGIEIDLNDIF
jgi:Uma2 family endonuclease